MASVLTFCSLRALGVITDGAAWKIGDATAAGIAFLRPFFTELSSLFDSIFSTLASGALSALFLPTFLFARLRGDFGSGAINTNSFVDKLLLPVPGLKSIRQIFFVANK